MEHTCIKPGCGTKYQSEDPDPYYCPTHDAERKAIAAQIDSKQRPSIPVQSDLQQFEERAKTFTGPDGRKIFFARASDVM